MRHLVLVGLALAFVGVSALEASASTITLLVETSACCQSQTGTLRDYDSEVLVTSGSGSISTSSSAEQESPVFAAGTASATSSVELTETSVSLRVGTSASSSGFLGSGSAYAYVEYVDTLTVAQAGEYTGTPGVFEVSWSLTYSLGTSGDGINCIERISSITASVSLGGFGDSFTGTSDGCPGSVGEEDVSFLVEAYPGTVWTLRSVLYLSTVANGDSLSFGDSLDSFLPFVTPITPGFSYETTSGSTYFRPALEPVPEPATLLLLGTGLGAVAARRRLKKRA